jgi:hypothetical protein
MWESRRLRTLWASTACYMESVTLFFRLSNRSFTHILHPVLCMLAMSLLKPQERAGGRCVSVLRPASRCLAMCVTMRKYTFILHFYATMRLLAYKCEETSSLGLMPKARGKPIWGYVKGVIEGGGLCGASRDRRPHV